MRQPSKTGMERCICTFTVLVYLGSSQSADDAITNMQVAEEHLLSTDVAGALDNDMYLTTQQHPTTCMRCKIGLLHTRATEAVAAAAAAPCSGVPRPAPTLATRSKTKREGGHDTRPSLQATEAMMQIGRWPGSALGGQLVERLYRPDRLESVLAFRCLFLPQRRLYFPTPQLVYKLAQLVDKFWQHER